MAEESKEKIVGGQKIITIPVIGVEMHEKTYIFAMEGIGIILAFMSTLTAISAYNQMKAASNDVTAVTLTWELPPVQSVAWIESSSECKGLNKPDGMNNWKEIPFMNYAGQTSLGCACNSDAMKKLTSPAGKSLNALSTPNVPCWTNQTDNLQYKCADVQGFPKVDLTSWKGQKLCMATGLTNAIDSLPMKAGLCPTGYVNCGGATGATFSSCQKILTGKEMVAGAQQCPIDWMAATATLATFSLDTAKANNYTDSQPSKFNSKPIPTKNYGAVGGLNYDQRGLANSNSLIVNNKSTKGVWVPLPLVNISMTMGAPCYGRPAALADQQMGITVNLADEGGTRTSGGNKCDADGDDAANPVDKRFQAQDTYDSGKLLLENYLRESGVSITSEGVKVTPSNVTGSFGESCQNAALKSTDYSLLGNYDFFNGTVAGTFSKIPFVGPCPDNQKNCARNANLGYKFVRNEGKCFATDILCKTAAEQTSCGLFQSLGNSATSNLAGVYMQSQIYWSEDCPYPKPDIVTADGPLQSAVSKQHTLLILNTMTNVILMFLGAYICYLCYTNFDKPTKHYAEMEEMWKPRIVTIANIIKIPVIILVITATKAIMTFYVTLADGGGCSDPTTNSTFTNLAQILPAVVTANTKVLILDILGFLPPIYAYFFPTSPKDVEGEGMADKEEEGANAVELSAAPAPPAPAPPAPGPPPANMGGMSNTAALFAPPPPAPASPPAPPAPSAEEEPAAVEEPAAEEGSEDTYDGAKNADGLPQGFGTMKYADGGEYKGNWFKAKRHGEGMMTYANGEKYIGTWRDDLRDGKGTLMGPGNKKIYEGDWFVGNQTD